MSEFKRNKSYGLPHSADAPFAMTMTKQVQT